MSLSSIVLHMYGNGQYFSLFFLKAEDVLSDEVAVPPPLEELESEASKLNIYF